MTCDLVIIQFCGQSVPIRSLQVWQTLFSPDVLKMVILNRSRLITHHIWCAGRCHLLQRHTSSVHGFEGVTGLVKVAEP